MDTSFQCIQTTGDWLKDFVVPLISALLGAGIGAYFSMRASTAATTLAHSNALELETERQKATVRGLILGIKAEIDCLRHIYEDEMLEDFLEMEDGTAFDIYYPISQGYFTVFESSAHLIGQIQDDEFQRIIIALYLKAKGIIDTHLLNNRMLNERSSLIDSSLPRDTMFSDRLSAIDLQLSDYAPNIRQNYLDAKELIRQFESKLPSVLARFTSEKV